MKFYGRESEKQHLKLLQQQSQQHAKMCVLTGHRRVGKTMLTLEFCKDQRFLYLFVSKKSEKLLCQEYVEDIQKVFDVPIIGKLESFKDVFQFLLELSITHPFVLIVDEFQEFYKINDSVYSEVQKLWDLYKNRSKLFTIFIGSIYSLMHQIFEDSHEPLFGRADLILKLKPFSIPTLQQILEDEQAFSSQALFEVYALSGGFPKYVNWLVDHQSFSGSDLANFVFSEHSPFIDEGKHVLIQEFGKDYGIYFSILELIASGKTSRSEMESILEKGIGGYLDRLENSYQVIARYKPISAKPESHLQKYYLQNHFLRFWFYFFFKQRSAVELQNWKYLRTFFDQQFPTFSGKTLEAFFKDLLQLSDQYNQIGSYWEKGNLNEIDIVAINDLEKKLLIAEVKRNPKKISLKQLQQKATRLLQKYPNYTVQYEGLSLEIVSQFLK